MITVVWPDHRWQKENSSPDSSRSGSGADTCLPNECLRPASASIRLVRLFDGGIDGFIELRIRRPAKCALSTLWRS